MTEKLADHLGGHCGITHVDEGAVAWLAKRGVKSMLDIGCGPGWQVAWARTKKMFAKGLDGDSNVNPDILHDFTKGEVLDPPKFESVWCVELLEHVDEIYLPNVMKLIEDIGAHTVICTAAPPGHPGRHHVNCQLFDYWEEQFKKIRMKYDDELTKEVMAASTMTRDFIRERGMVFVK
jgi:hypothetical protein